MHVWDFGIIDEMFVEEEILQHISAMSDEQKRVHVITTATLDVAYPFAYGFFHAGMAYRYLGGWGKWVAAPLIWICMPVDLVEGFAQVMLLRGQSEYVGLKAIVTPIKLAVFMPSLVFTIIALLVLGFHHYCSRKPEAKDR